MKINKSTFIIQVMGREHGSCQGVINWVDRRESTAFRSTLELMHLIDSAVNSKEEK